MFLIKLRALCADADWCAEHRQDIDIDLLYAKAEAVVATGRRSGLTSRKAFADSLDILINSGDYTADDLIDTFKDII